jgi:hypothetical protein
MVTSDHCSGTVLVKDANLSDSELDDFLADARKLADEWLADAN